MIRPKRCRIMPFSAARESRNAASRLTRSTSCQSSSFMRTASPSRVRPALLTRMSSPPISRSASGTSASTDAAIGEVGGGDVRALAELAGERLQRVDAACPTASRSRPGACSASAIAPPIPPLAPVTSARFPSRLNTRASPSSAARPRALDLVRRADRRLPSRPARCACARPVSTLPAPISTNARRRRSPPSHAIDSRQRTVPVTCSTSRWRISVGSESGARQHIGDERHRRRMDLRRRRARSPSLPPRAASARNGRARRRRAAWRAARPALGDLDRALDRRLVPGDHDLARRIVVGDLADLVGGRRFRARPPRAASRSRPSSAAIAPTPSGTAFCMASPRMRSSRAASPMREAPGGGERRILAERMAGDEGGMSP